MFDVDFTLIYPGPMFRGEGYRAFCERYGIDVDVSRFEQAVASAAPMLDDHEDAVYDAEIFVKYTRHIIEQMGGRISVESEVGRGSTFILYLPVWDEAERPQSTREEGQLGQTIAGS